MVIIGHLFNECRMLSDDPPRSRRPTQCDPLSLQRCSSYDPKVASKRDEARENARNFIPQYVCVIFDPCQKNPSIIFSFIADKCELKNLLSTISEIPEENIEYAKLQPRDSVSVLQIHTTLQWTSTPNRSDDYSSSTSFQDGNVLYYR